jgi:hypothetical protein
LETRVSCLASCETAIECVPSAAEVVAVAVTMLESLLDTARAARGCVAELVMAVAADCSAERSLFTVP